MLSGRRKLEESIASLLGCSSSAKFSQLTPCNSVCVLCDQLHETIVHLCLQCAVCQGGLIWDLVPQWSGGRTVVAFYWVMVEFFTSMSGGILHFNVFQEGINVVWLQSSSTQCGTFGRREIGGSLMVWHVSAPTKVVSIWWQCDMSVQNL